MDSSALIAQAFNNRSGVQNVAVGSSTQHNNTNQGTGTMNNVTNTAGSVMLNQGVAGQYAPVQVNNGGRLHQGDNHFYGQPGRLKHVVDAVYNAYGVDHTPCHPKTRKELLAQIDEWVAQPSSPSIFWLNGMAGTGKSTIAYTIAHRLDNGDSGRDVKFGASFFFKRGEGDRASAVLFFPTIAHQLCQKIPGLAVHMSQAVQNDPDLCSKSLGEQFDKLIKRPLASLGELNAPRSYVVVVDALDECKNEDDIETLLRLWSTLRLRTIRIQMFLTSRPELPIRMGFKDMQEDTHHNVVLHELPIPMIQQDIEVFLYDELADTRKRYNRRFPRSTPLDHDWPGHDVIHRLTMMAIPLFIIATTLCRFIHHRQKPVHLDPRKQLEILLQAKPVYISKIGHVYHSILAQMLALLDDSEGDWVCRQFRLVVGTIVNVAEPLSLKSLARLLGLETYTVEHILDPLHSVLWIPDEDEAPVRPLHLSFGEYLCGGDISDGRFRVYPIDVHQHLVERCLHLLSQELGENMCHFEYPGQPRSDLNSSTLNEYLSPAARYACRHWTHHAQECGLQIRDNDEVHQFLQRHLLHWLEAMSLMGRVSETIACASTLQSLVSVGVLASVSLCQVSFTDVSQKSRSELISAFLQDTHRFILSNRHIISLSPLQVYSSAMIFTPQKSVVRQTCGQIPRWVISTPVTPKAWSAELQKLEGHTSEVDMVAFSPDGSQLASASYDQTVRVWDAKTGQALQILEGHTDRARAVAFSPDGSQLASASNDETVRLWDAKTGQTIQILEGHTDYVWAVAYSPDGSQLASASRDKTVRVWDAKIGQAIQTLEGHTAYVWAMAFSPDGSQLASASYDQTVRVWDAKTGQALQILEGHTDWVSAVAFSPNGSQLASASYDETVRVWDAKTGQAIQTLKGHTSSIYTIAFSPDGSQLASASQDETVRLWDAKTGQALRILKGHTRSVDAVAFSPDGSQLASASGDKTVRLWDAKTGQAVQTFEGHTHSVNAVAFSPSSSQLASASDDWTVRLWDAKTEQAIQTLEGHAGSIYAMAFSPDGSQLASASNDQTVRVWDAKTGQALRILKGHIDLVSSVVYSPDGSQLASTSSDKTVRLWDAKTGQAIQILEGHIDLVSSVVYSPDGSLLASASNDKTVRLWDAKTGQALQILEGHTDWVSAVAFSPNGSQLASASLDKTVRVWDAKTGNEASRPKGYPYVYGLDFSSDMWTRLTNYGVIDSKHIHALQQREPIRQLLLKDQWIQWDGRDMLWLPHEYRGAVWAVHRNVLAIGRSSGIVSFVGLDCSLL